MALNNAQTKTNSSAFRSMLEKHQLTVPNFNEWFRALKLVVRTEKLQDVFETALPPAPAAGVDVQALPDWVVLFYRHNEVACLMLGTMSPKLYQQFEHNSPLEWLLSSKKCMENLWVLNSKSCGRVQKYKPQGKAKGKGKGKGPQNSYPTKPKKPQPYKKEHPAKDGQLVQKYKPQGKAKGKGKGKGPQNSYPTKPKKPQPYKKEHPAKDGQCHHCKEEGHWKRNCPLYLVELMKKKKKTEGQNVASTSSESVARILNMVPTKKVDKTPYELWHGKVPNLSYLKETMGYYFYYPPENKIVVERYAYFLEKDFILQKESGRIVELKDEDILPSENTSEHPIEEEILAPIVSQEEDVIPFRRSVRTHKAPDRLCLYVKIDPDRLCFNVKVEEHSLGDLNEPANYKAAVSDPEFEKWLIAMNSKWIYKKKTDMDGKVHIYKARLVAKGCTQTYGVDYEETFSHVADIRAIRILIAIAAYYDYEIWQIDVKIAFFNGFLEEEIYMEQPEGFIDPNHHRKVCKLQRSIYGLKKASRSWNKRFDKEIKKFGFHQNIDEPCVYQKASGSNVIFLILYVDDIILIGNHIPSLQEVKTYLGKCFSMKDLGEAAFILRIKIYKDRSRQLIRLSQNA
nr:retrotransposon protein, putative, Ty1-copia subclass [Tanacetum cinerariifolium]